MVRTGSEEEWGEKGWFWGPEMDTVVGGTGFFSLLSSSQGIWIHPSPFPQNMLFFHQAPAYLHSYIPFVSMSSGTFLYYWYSGGSYRERKDWSQRDLWGRNLSCPYYCQFGGRNCFGVWQLPLEVKTPVYVQSSQWEQEVMTVMEWLETADCCLLQHK